MPLTAGILQFAAACQTPFDLTPQDAIVYASVMTHLREQTPSKCCLLNRNSKDFDNPNIVDEFAKFDCKMIPRFDQGLSYIQTR